MMDEASAARRYARIRYRLLLAECGLGWCVLSVFQGSGASTGIARWTAGWAGPEVCVIAGYLAVFGAVSYAVSWPLHFYGSFLLERQFGLSRLNLAGWWGREGKRVAVSALLSLLLVEGGYAILRAAPRAWPVWATIGWVGFSVLLARVFPTLILPIFYKTRPLPDEALVARLLALCDRVGLPALGVFRFDLGVETRKANAALAGLGATRRVLLADTLLAEFPPEEIEGVLAHELGHHRYQHIRKLLLLSAVGSWGMLALTALVSGRWVARLGLRGIADIAGLPMLLLWLSVLGFLGLPLQNGLSRYFEWQADRFAVQITNAPQAFASALRRLARLNLADPNPPRWAEVMFYDHPRISERIRVAASAAPRDQ